MTDRIERRPPEILTRISAPQVPDYTDDILGLTARRRQRPGWTFPGRWLPMDITAPRPTVARTQWRPIGIVILLILALAAAAVVYIGSRPPRLAPFFGPAANGSFVYVTARDIYIADANLEQRAPPCRRARERDRGGMVERRRHDPLRPCRAGWLRGHGGRS